jgi:hypothetical protein
VAFALYCTPLLYMWEKLIGTHTKPWYMRLPSRLPVGESHVVYVTLSVLAANACFACCVSARIALTPECCSGEFHKLNAECARAAAKSFSLRCSSHSMMRRGLAKYDAFLPHRSVLAVSC